MRSITARRSVNSRAAKFHSSCFPARAEGTLVLHLLSAYPRGAAHVEAIYYVGRSPIDEIHYSLTLRPVTIDRYTLRLRNDTDHSDVVIL